MAMLSMWKLVSVYILVLLTAAMHSLGYCYIIICISMALCICPDFHPPLMSSAWYSVHVGEREPGQVPSRL